jgi:hypothetical protein
MATPGDQAETQPARPPSRSKLAMVRKVVAPILVVLLSAVAYLEWNAHRRAGEACRKLEDAYEERLKTQVPLSRKKVEELVDRAPDGPGIVEGDRLTVSYTWRGVFRKHVITASYDQGEDPQLINVSCE